MKCTEVVAMYFKEEAIEGFEVDAYGAWVSTVKAATKLAQSSGSLGVGEEEELIEEVKQLISKSDPYLSWE